MRWYITPPNGEPVYEVELGWEGVHDALPAIKAAYDNDNSAVVVGGQFRSGNAETVNASTVFTFAPGTHFTPKVEAG